MVEFYPFRSYTIEELRNCVLGIDNSLPRTKAIALLLASESQTKYKDFQNLLENQNESPTVRYLAAISLGKMNTVEAKEILVKNIQTQNEEVLTGIFMALGRIGDKNSVEVILGAKDRSTGFAKSQAEFAAALISYRLGLEGNELAIPKEEDYFDMPIDTQQMDISEAPDDEVKKCLSSLVSGTEIGIRLAEKPAYQVYYDRGIGMVLFNLAFTSQRDFHMLLRRKIFLGVFADKVQESRSYSIAYLIFTSPDVQHGRINILLTRPDGRLVFGGKAEVEKITLNS